MDSGRLEAFSDGVIAIIITIMVLDLKVPHAANPAALLQLWPIFLSYVVSFFVVAIYWMNHHRVFHFVKVVDNRILWSNIVLLFSLSLIPFATDYMGENRVSTFSTALYSLVMLCCGLAFTGLRMTVAEQFRHDEQSRPLERAASRKNRFALTLYAAAVPAAYLHPAVSLIFIFIVAAIYFLPNAWISGRPAIVGAATRAARLGRPPS